MLSELILVINKSTGSYNIIFFARKTHFLGRLDNKSLCPELGIPKFDAVRK
jgi:hypothetical protein